MLDSGQSSHPSPAPQGPESMRPLLAVLAGGAGSRLGGDKALAALAGIPLLCHAIAAGRRARLDVLVVAKPRTRLPAPDQLRAPVLRESSEREHPLSGVIAALEHAAPRPVVAIGCDMPLVPPALLAALASRPRPAVVMLRGRPEPLLARHEQAQLPELEAALTAEAPFAATLQALGYEQVEEIELARFGDPRRFCLNVNLPEDLARAERLLMNEQDA